MFYRESRGELDDVPWHSTDLTRQLQCKLAWQEDLCSMYLCNTSGASSNHNMLPDICRLSTVAASAWRTKLKMGLNISACSAVSLYSRGNLSRNYVNRQGHELQLLT